MNQTYMKYKSMGLCVKCGSIVADGQIYCIGCREKRSIQRKREREMKKRERELAKNPKINKKPMLSLEEVNRMAKERGVSYGQMVTLLEMEKG